MFRRVSLTVMAGVAVAATAWAATYLEFNPDYAQSLLVASAPGAVSQVFLPLNEHLAGFDVWVSNGSTAGQATFTLYSPTDAVLLSRTVTIPAIADSESGTRFSVALPSQLAVTGSLPYRVRIATAAPTLRLYYAPQYRILTHNGAPLPAYTGGLARIGDEDQAYSFKFALAENAETTPPVLSGVVVSQPGTGTVVLSFNASEPVDARVAYGDRTVAYTGQYAACLPDVSACDVTLMVTPGIAYPYTLTVRDVWGNEAAVTGQFTANGEPPASGTPSPGTTPPLSPTATPDIVAPVISNLRVVNVSATGATIAWTTDEAANGIVAVFTLPYLTFGAGDNDGTLELEHAFRFDSLQQGLGYRARVTSSDAAGNSASGSVEFLTGTPTPSPAQPTPTPSPTPATPTPSVSSTPAPGGGQDIAWPAPGGGTPQDGYRVDIIGPDGKLIRTIRTTGTTVNIGEVPEGSTVIVYGDDGGVFTKVAEPMKVRKISLWERLLTLLPYILGGLVVAIGATVGVLVWRKKRRAAMPAVPPAGQV